MHGQHRRRQGRHTATNEAVTTDDGTLDEDVRLQKGPAGSAAMGREQVRGSALLLMGRVASLLLTTATQIVIVRVLTKADFGAFAYALALVAAGRILLSLGQGKLLSRFMSTYEEQRDYDRMFGAMFLAAGTIVVTTGLTLTALFIFRDPLIGSAVGGGAAVQMVFILAFLGPLEAFDQVFVSLFAVFSKPRAIFFRKYLLTPGLRLVVVVVLAVTGAGVTLLAVGYVVAQLIGLMLYFGMLIGMLRERGLLGHLRLRRIVLPYRAVFSFSIPLITSELVSLSMNVGGVLILAFYQSIEEVANYRAVLPAARLNQVVFAVFVTLFLPMAARLFARNDREGLRHSYWQTALFLAVFTFPIFAVTGPFAPTTTEVLFGARYAESAVVLALLAAGYYFNVMLGFNAFTVQVCGRIRYLVGVNVVVGVLNLALSFALVPRLGAAGVAIANLTALVTQNVLNQLALRGSIGSGFVDRRHLRGYAVIIGCAALLFALQVLVRPGLVLSLVAASVASLIVLAANLRALELGETFPELMRVPLLRRLLVRASRPAGTEGRRQR